jgi:type I site-specific restriction endonuclease
VVVNYLLVKCQDQLPRKEGPGTHKEIVFCVLEDHVYRLVLEKDFSESNYIFVVNFTVQLKQKRVLNFQRLGDLYIPQFP